MEEGRPETYWWGEGVDDHETQGGEVMDTVMQCCWTTEITSSHIKSNSAMNTSGHYTCTYHTHKFPTLQTILATCI